MPKRRLKFHPESDVALSGVKRDELESIYPFTKMADGDSFFVPLEGETMEKVRSRITSSYHALQVKRRKREDYTFEYYRIKTRRAEKDGEDGVRVWLERKFDTSLKKEG